MSDVFVAALTDVGLTLLSYPNRDRRIRPLGEQMHGDGGL